MHLDVDGLPERLAELLAAEWGIDAPHLTRLHGGMTSYAALVESTGQVAVVKCVAPEFATGLERGAVTARRLAQTGLRTGCPYRSRSGTDVVRRPWGATMLMERVQGRELTESPEDQVRMARALALIHSVDVTRTEAPFMDHLGADERLVEQGDWILPAIRDAVARYRSLGPTPWGIINTDPSPDSFLLEEATGQVGVIDWSEAGNGPILYDVASVVMYLGGEDRAEPFLTAYAELGPVGPEELREQLPVFRRFRAAVQADYFAHRILARDMTGIQDEQENHVGLSDAREMFREADRC